MYTGEVESVIKETLTEVGGQNPLVTASEGSLAAVAGAVYDRGVSVRMLADPDAISSARWPTRGRLQDLLAAGTALREGTADSVAVVSDDRAALVDTTPSRPSVVVGSTDNGLTEAYTGAWRRGSPVDIDASEWSAVERTVERAGGAAAVDDLRYATAELRSRGAGPLRTAIWAASRPAPTDAPRLARLLDMSDDLGVSRQTIRSRANELDEHGLVSLVPDPSGGRGRPPLVVHRQVTRPLNSAALQLLIN